MKPTTIDKEFIDTYYRKVDERTCLANNVIPTNYRARAVIAWNLEHPEDKIITRKHKRKLPDLYLTFSNDGKPFTLEFPYGVNRRTPFECSYDTLEWEPWYGSRIGSEDSIYVRGKGVRYLTGKYELGFVFNGSTCTGSIETLLDYELVGKKIHPEMFPYCFAGLFWECTNLREAPDLPATELAHHCYEGMFEGCTSLLKAPELPSTTLAEDCYKWMFWNCTSLTEAPIMPANANSKAHAMEMFKGCKKLKV